MQKPSTPPDIGNADRSGGILATSILALTVVIVFISLRFVTRIFLVKRVGWEDWCIVFAGVSHTALRVTLTEHLSGTVRAHYRHGIDRFVNRLRFWETGLLFNGASDAGVHEVCLWGMVASS